METILQAKHITKMFPGVKALDDVELTVNRGEVLALLGENGAGKSTLMKIILGMYIPDEGEIYYKGEKVAFRNPSEALNHGISMIHQEISLVPTLDVSENIWLGREKKFLRGGLISKRDRDAATRNLLEELGIHLEPTMLVSRLSVAQMQMVEIARAVSYRSDIIIMDEPTSALTDTEVEILFRLIRQLTAGGTAVIYISHKMDEILQIADRASIFRDGRYIATVDCQSTNQAQLINMIAGREMSEMFPKEPAPIGGVVLEVQHLTRAGVFQDVSFQVHAGEILGFCGLVGAGRTEIMRAIFGIDKYDSGTLILEGREVHFHSPQQAIQHGLAMITEDRLRQGALHKLSVKANMSLAYLPEIARVGFIIDGKRETRDCQEQVEHLNIALAGLGQLIGTLSGGNQQKVIIGKWLLTKPKVLIMDEPTRGIDVGAKAEIHRLLCTLAKAGMAIILISSEMPEVMGMSDRIFVVHDGKLVHECTRDNFPSQETLMAHAFGLENHDVGSP